MQLISPTKIPPYAAFDRLRPPKEFTVHLGSEEIGFCKQTAELRNRTAFASKRRSHKWVKNLSDVDVHFLGCLGELAFAKFLGVPWSASNGVYQTQADQNWCEIRTRTKKSYDLYIRPSDQLCAAWVLSICAPPEKPLPTNLDVLLIGWIWGQWACRSEWGHKYGAGPFSWWVPQRNLLDLSILKPLILSRDPVLEWGKGTGPNPTSVGLTDRSNT